MLAQSRLFSNTPSHPARSPSSQSVLTRRTRSEIRTASNAPTAARFTRPAAGIAIVQPGYATNMDPYVVMITPRKTPADRLLLIDGVKPTFVSRGSGSAYNKRQLRAQLEENNRRALGLYVPPKKTALRKRMDEEGCIFFTDGYVRRHSTSKIASQQDPYQRLFKLETPACPANMSAKKRREKQLNYLIHQAEVEHRPVYRRVPTSEIYGEVCEYTENAENAHTVPAVCNDAASPVQTHHAPEATCPHMNQTWSAFSLDQGVSSSDVSSCQASPSN